MDVHRLVSAGDIEFAGFECPLLVGSHKGEVTCLDAEGYRFAFTRGECNLLEPTQAAII